MPHKLPPIPFFRVSPPTDPIQEIALRVVVELPGQQWHVIGSAVVIGSYLAVTARHVIDEAFGKFGARKGYSLRLYQVLPRPAGPIYRIWGVVNTWTCETDIAILHLGLDRTYGDLTPNATIEWKPLCLRLTPPPKGHIVCAFGYRGSEIDVSLDANGNHNIDLKDFGTTSGGHVGQIFPNQRDSSSLTFPCFEVLARYDAGMSGGVVIDENGMLCGLVSTEWDFAEPDEQPLGYASTLWPMLRTEISADRGDAYPRGVSYPVFDLVKDKILHTVGLEDLDPKLFPGCVLPRP